MTLESLDIPRVFKMEEVGGKERILRRTSKLRYKLKKKAEFLIEFSFF